MQARVLREADSKVGLNVQGFHEEACLCDVRYRGKPASRLQSRSDPREGEREKRCPWTALQSEKASALPSGNL